VVVDRRFLAQPRKGRIRIGVDPRVVGVVVDVGFMDDGHRCFLASGSFRELSAGPRAPATNASLPSIRPIWSLRFTSFGRLPNFGRTPCLAALYGARQGPGRVANCVMDAQRIDL